MSGALPPLLQYSFMTWCPAKKHRENFTFTFTFHFWSRLHERIKLYSIQISATCMNVVHVTHTTHRKSDSSR